MSVPNDHIRPVLRRRLTTVLLAVALASLAACGGSDSSDTDTASAPTTASASTTQAQPNEAAPTSDPAAESDVRTITATEEDFSISLDDEELSAGEYEIEARNEGDATHNLMIEQDGEDVAGTAAIAPGASETLTVTLEPGEYVFYCSIGAHRSMGMELSVTVS